MVTEPGPRESVVVDAYTGRRPRTIPSARLHETSYIVTSRRYVKSGYARIQVSTHMAGVVRAALKAREMSEDLVDGANFTDDPVLGGTLALACPPGHPAVRICMVALAALGRSAVVSPERDRRTVLRVRYGPGGTLCPVRWMTRDDWTLHYCGKPLGHADGEHQEPQTYELFADGDDDALKWPGRRTPPTKDPLPLEPPSPTAADWPVLHDQVLDATEYERIPPQRRYFGVQLRTTALRRSKRPQLVTYGPLDQAEPEATVAAVTDGAGMPWHRRTDGAGMPWHRRTDGTWRRTGSGAAEHEPDLPWHLLAFRYAPLTQVAEH
ncbi:hypothetical protein OG350_37380 [Streptomyces achromogenes]|uniref:Uncharacterized protein n=1 Tax=Streptomyces achromogenes TaxID=67255 RepID=A0ABZ1KYF9_STRAH